MANELLTGELSRGMKNKKQTFEMILPRRLICVTVRNRTTMPMITEELKTKPINKTTVYYDTPNT